MKEIMRFWLCLLFFSIEATLPKIHILGDSHASYCFTNQYPLQAVEQSIYNYQSVNGNVQPIAFVIHWFKEVTMHRVGRDGLNCINLSSKQIPEKSVAVFVFGEIDIRCHLGKQCNRQQKPIEEVVADVVQRYTNTLRLNRNLYNNLTIVICGPMPPAQRNSANYNPQFPFYGTIEDRIKSTNLMRQYLADACEQNGFLYLDIYDLYCTARGDLSYDISDGIVHVNPIYNEPIKKRLINLLHQAQIGDFANI